MPLNTETIAKCSGTSKLSYANARVTLQKALCVRSNPTARDLCIQFGCARLEAAVRATLASYKQRFAASLPECQRGNLDFSRPVFLAASFYLIARKNRVKVSRERLLSTLGITGTELNATVASITALLPEVVAQQERKRRADRENTAGGDASGSESGSDEADAGDAPAAGSRGGRKKQRAGEDRGLEENALEQAGVEKPERRRTRLTEKKLRQAVLQFGGGAENEKVTAV